MPERTRAIGTEMRPLDGVQTLSGGGVRHPPPVENPVRRQREGCLARLPGETAASGGGGAGVEPLTRERVREDPLGGLEGAGRVENRGLPELPLPRPSSAVGRASCT